MELKGQESILVLTPGAPRKRCPGPRLLSLTRKGECQPLFPTWGEFCWWSTPDLEGPAQASEDPDVDEAVVAASMIDPLWWIFLGLINLYKLNFKFNIYHTIKNHQKHRREDSTNEKQEK